MTFNFNPKYLFFFCVGVFAVSFLAMMALIYIDFPEKSREMAANTQGFLQGSLIMSVIGFLLTGNIGDKKTDHSKVTTEVTPESTTVTTEPIVQPKDDTK